MHHITRQRRQPMGADDDLSLPEVQAHPVDCLQKCKPVSEQHLPREGRYQKQKEKKSKKEKQQAKKHTTTNRKNDGTTTSPPPTHTHIHTPKPSVRVQLCVLLPGECSTRHCLWGRAERAMVEVRVVGVKLELRKHCVPELGRRRGQETVFRFKPRAGQSCL